MGVAGAGVGTVVRQDSNSRLEWSGGARGGKVWLGELPGLWTAAMGYKYSAMGDGAPVRRVLCGGARVQFRCNGRRGLGRVGEAGGGPV